ncbi:hypothetical protein U1Q18_030067 [Sarracenia purpurea var. burkii]
MDFYNLTRRELQNLYKKDEIPANTTNIAMTDALKSLEIVEGMEEFLKPSESETPYSSIESPCVPHTDCRISTKRKPIKEELESLQILMRTRHGSRKENVGERGSDNAEHPKKSTKLWLDRKRVTPLKTEAKDMKNVPETPAVVIARRQGTSASARQKMETSTNLEEVSVRQVYNTSRITYDQQDDLSPGG